MCNLGAAEGQPKNLVQVSRDVHVQTPGKIPRLHDPMVVQTPGNENENNENILVEVINSSLLQLTVSPSSESSSRILAVPSLD